RDHRRDDARPLRQQRGHVTHTSLAARKAIADNTDHHGDPEHGGEAGDQHQPAYFGHDARRGGIQGFFVIFRNSTHCSIHNPWSVSAGNYWWPAMKPASDSTACSRPAPSL